MMAASNTLPTLALIVAVSALVSGAPIEDDGLFSLSFSRAGSLQLSMHLIWDMEWDQFKGGKNMLVAWSNALITTDGTQHTTLAGDLDDTGYVEGKGHDARFDKIVNFLQISKYRVVIVDRGNSCLRLLDRLTGQTSPFAGKCGVRGFKDGNKDETLFDYPSDVMFDERDRTKLIVLDDYNDAIRSVDIATQVTTTIFMNDTVLLRPRAGAFDLKNKDILYVTHRRKVSMYNFADNTVTLLAGGEPEDPKKFTVFDGSFESATFGYYTADVVQINDRFLAISDIWVSKVRIIDLINRKVFSICADEVVQAFDEAPGDKLEECDITMPVGLMYDNGKLYIGENGRITVKSVTINESTPGDNGVVG